MKKKILSGLVDHSGRAGSFVLNGTFGQSYRLIARPKTGTAFLCELGEGGTENLIRWERPAVASGVLRGPRKKRMMLRENASR